MFPLGGRRVRPQLQPDPSVAIIFGLFRLFRSLFWVSEFKALELLGGVGEF